MFKFLALVHYYILSKKYIGGIYGFIHVKYIKFKKYIEYLKFKFLNQPPRLNKHNIASFVGDSSIKKDSHDKLELSALIHVTFHFDKSRLTYLNEVVNQLNGLSLTKKNIVVDTNTTKLIKYVERLGLDCKVNVNDKLSHPFRLTWAHRDDMQSESENYDVFIYLEDDIFIPNATLYRWFEERERLKKHGFLPGFVRIETNRKQKLVASDYEYPLSNDNVIELEGRPYLATPFPYQACWIYDKEAMREFIDSYSFTNGYTEYEKHNWIRENAAIGLAYESAPEGYPSRHLVALDEHGKISPETYIFHLPCNYGINRNPHPSGLGTVEVDSIIQYSK